VSGDAEAFVTADTSLPMAVVAASRDDVMAAAAVRETAGYPFSSLFRASASGG